MANVDDVIKKKEELRKKQLSILNELTELDRKLEFIIEGPRGRIQVAYYNTQHRSINVNRCWLNHKQAQEFADWLKDLTMEFNF